MKILVPTAGTPPAKETAEYVSRIARGLGAEILVLHVYEGEEPSADGLEAVSELKTAAESVDIPVRTLVEKGHVVDAIVEVGRREKVSLVVMGISAGKVVDQWISAEALHKSELPVVVIPHVVTSRQNRP
jgi:nucleotide-binding universal stress UspA family protein